MEPDTRYQRFPNDDDDSNESNDDDDDDDSSSDSSGGYFDDLTPEEREQDRIQYEEALNRQPLEYSSEYWSKSLNSLVSLLSDERWPPQNKQAKNFKLWEEWVKGRDSFCRYASELADLVFVEKYYDEEKYFRHIIPEGTYSDLERSLIKTKLCLGWLNQITSHNLRTATNVEMATVVLDWETHQNVVKKVLDQMGIVLAYFEICTKLTKKMHNDDYEESGSAEAVHFFKKSLQEFEQTNKKFFDELFEELNKHMKFFDFLKNSKITQMVGSKAYEYFTEQGVNLFENDMEAIRLSDEFERIRKLFESFGGKMFRKDFKFDVQDISERKPKADIFRQMYTFGKTLNGQMLYEIRLAYLSVRSNYERLFIGNPM